MMPEPTTPATSSMVPIASAASCAVRSGAADFVDMLFQCQVVELFYRERYKDPNAIGEYDAASRERRVRG